MTFKDTGFVLKEAAVGEADKIITVLLLENGKLSLSAKGARKPKSKFLAACQPFSLSEFVIFEGNGFLSVAQADLRENYFSMLGDFEVYKHAAFMAEMTEKLVFPGSDARDALRLLIAAFRAMHVKCDPKLCSAVFRLKFLQQEGLAPETAEDFDMRLNDTVIYALNYILNNDIDKIFAFGLEKKHLDLLYNAISEFMERHIDIKFKSLSL